jgi:FAD/FMN-containing dehydrogenase
MNRDFLIQVGTILDLKYVLTEDADKAPYLTDWRNRFTGRALAVLLPSTSAEVAAIVKLCASTKTAIVPQGGNTGLCGGATPDQSGKQVILSLKRMKQIREIDVANQTISLEAGCILQTIQEKAAEQRIVCDVIEKLQSVVIIYCKIFKCCYGFYWYIVYSFMRNNHPLC